MVSNIPIRVLIVDDEPMVRENLAAYFEDEDWCTECSFEGGVFYSSGSLKDYESTISAFVKVLPMFGDEHILISVGEDWVYDKEDEVIEVYKSENCRLSFDLLEEEK